MNYGVIGTAAGVERFGRWAKTMSNVITTPAGAEGKGVAAAQHIPFPGFEEAFGATWNTEAVRSISDLDEEQISRTIRIENRHEAIEKTVSMYVDRLVAEQKRSENPPSLWFVVIPDEIYRLGRPQSKVPRSDREKGEVRLTRTMADPGTPQILLFEEDREEAEIYKYAKDFRRQAESKTLERANRYANCAGEYSNAARLHDCYGASSKKDGGPGNSSMEAWYRGLLQGWRATLATCGSPGGGLLCGTGVQEDVGERVRAFCLLCGPDVFVGR